MGKLRIRRLVVTILVLGAVMATIATRPESYAPINPPQQSEQTADTLRILETLAVKGRAPKTGYKRSQFGDGWRTVGVCDMRNIILHRDLKHPIVDEKCHVLSGVLNDPYTGAVIHFTRGEQTSALVQIDHVVALSNAWQTGAQQLTVAERENLANDPLNLLAVDGPANQQKSDGDAATWLPPNKVFRCQYVTRQVEVKAKYRLWLTSGEKQAIQTVLARC